MAASLKPLALSHDVNFQTHVHVVDEQSHICIERTVRTGDLIIFYREQRKVWQMRVHFVENNAGTTQLSQDGNTFVFQNVLPCGSREWIVVDVPTGEILFKRRMHSVDNDTLTRTFLAPVITNSNRICVLEAKSTISPADRADRELYREEYGAESDCKAGQLLHCIAPAITPRDEEYFVGVLNRRGDVRFDLEPVCLRSQADEPMFRCDGDKDVLTAFSLQKILFVTNLRTQKGLQPRSSLEIEVFAVRMFALGKQSPGLPQVFDQTILHSTHASDIQWSKAGSFCSMRDYKTLILHVGNNMQGIRLAVQDDDGYFAAWIGDNCYFDPSSYYFILAPPPTLSRNNKHILWQQQPVKPCDVISASRYSTIHRVIPIAFVNGSDVRALVWFRFSLQKCTCIGGSDFGCECRCYERRNGRLITLTFPMDGSWTSGVAMFFPLHVRRLVFHLMCVYVRMTNHQVNGLAVLPIEVWLLMIKILCAGVRMTFDDAVIAQIPDYFEYAVHALQTFSPLTPSLPTTS